MKGVKQMKEKIKKNKERGIITMEKQKLRKNKGITLIALVITIVLNCLRSGRELKCRA